MVPVVVGRPFKTLVALRLAPYLAALRAPALRVERVPGVAALAGPLGARGGLPFTFGAVDFHDPWEKALRRKMLVDKGLAGGYSRVVIREK